MVDMYLRELSTENGGGGLGNVYVEEGLDWVDCRTCKVALACLLGMMDSMTWWVMSLVAEKLTLVKSWQH